MKPRRATGRSVVLQERDLALLRMLAEEFRILTREQIGELFPMGSTARINFRLKQLRQAGYLSSRVIAGFGAAVKLGYVLGPRSPEVFDPIERGAVTSIRMQAAQLAPSGLAHRLLVDSIHIRFLTATRENPNYKLVTWIDQYSPFWAELRDYGVPVQADGYVEFLMLLHFENLFTFFLEVDRGTESGKVMLEKFTRYAEYAATGAYERRFAARPFRVLLVTNSERRIKSLLELAASKSATLFWITSWERFKSAKLLDPYWLRPGRDGTHSLLSDS